MRVTQYKIEGLGHLSTLIADEAAGTAAVVDPRRDVDVYLEAAREKGLIEVRLIHGKGTGARRAEIRRMLASRTDIVEFSDATPDRGSFGATLVRLRPREG